MSNYTKKSMPQLDELLLQLGRGEMPNFWTLMSALGDIADNAPDIAPTKQQPRQRPKSSGCEAEYPLFRNCPSC